MRRLGVDCYCLQHPDRYCVSAKSLTAHLTGVCWAIEHRGEERGLFALQRSLDGAGQPTKPQLPQSFGEVTVADVAAAGDLPGAVRDWARSTWGAYSDLHPFAEGWIAAATRSS